MIDDEMYETCRDCPYVLVHYGEIDQCMFGFSEEEDNLDDWEKKCEVRND